MDFQLLVSNRGRIVIEVDGRQHYSDDEGRASPDRYAEMVKEDRLLRLAETSQAVQPQSRARRQMSTVM
jgi:very-short-patch-repair endonuclease